MKSAVLALIPARAGSKRLPHKHTRRIGGAPLIEYTINAAQAASLVSDVVVATDDDEVAEIGRACGVTILERPEALCRDTSPIDDTLQYAFHELAGSLGAPLEQLVWLQADVPIRQPGMIDRVVAALRVDCSATAAVTGLRVSQHPGWMKELNTEGFLVPVEPDVTAYRMQDLPDRFLLDGAVVAIHPANLEQCSEPAGVHRYLGRRPRLLLHEDPMYSLNVDTEKHLELAEFYLGRTRA